MPQRTDLQFRCDTVLGEPVETWAHKRYKVLRSWRAVALDLSDRVGREIDRTTLMNWVKAAGKQIRTAS